MNSVQLLLARIVEPVRLMLLGEIVTRLVSQSPPRLSGLAMSSPEGISSLKLTPVKSVAGLGLVMVNVSVTLWFRPTVAELNALVMVGGDCACTFVTNAPINKSAGKTTRYTKRFAIDGMYFFSYLSGAMVFTV